MKRLAPVVFLLAAFALVACGSDDQRSDPAGGGGTGGAGGAVGPTAPAFAGLAEVTSDGAGLAYLYWLPASDAETAAEEIRYKVWVWQTHPDGGSTGDSYDWTQTIDRCTPRCRWQFSLGQDNVTWFAVEAIDADEMSTGLEVVVPATTNKAEPSITGVSPTSADVGDEVEVIGENFLDERTSDDALTLGGEPIEAEFITGWDTRRIRFVLPAGFASGAIGVKTLNGTATAELVVNE